jgi:hypothetical protein
MMQQTVEGFSSELGLKSVSRDSNADALSPHVIQEFLSPYARCLPERYERAGGCHGQIEGLAKRDVLAQNEVINQLFELAASRALATLLLTPHPVFATQPVDPRFSR